jgi:hypothetical protein
MDLLWMIVEIKIDFDMIHLSFDFDFEATVLPDCMVLHYSPCGKVFPAHLAQRGC